MLHLFCEIKPGLYWLNSHFFGFCFLLSYFRTNKNIWIKKSFIKNNWL